MSSSKRVQSEGEGHKGFPKQIIKVKEDRSLELDTEALNSVLSKPSVIDKPVMVISVAGDFRKGKSFLLNFFLRYLISMGFDNWIGDSSSPLNGFSWRNGTEGNTEGVLLWSEPFVVPLLNTNSDIIEVAILLMDTQGVFSRGTRQRESVIIFALSALLSSVQIYNLKNNIQENDLQSLEMFMEYGRLVLEVSNDKPFQRLMFLIRDWENPSEHPYGLNGGRKFLDKCLHKDNIFDNEAQRVRRNIHDYFSTTECFLMPHPGLNVTNENFVGKIADIDIAFVNNLKTFVEHIFKPENLSVKKIGGCEVKGKDLILYFQRYVEILVSDKIPEPKTLVRSTAEVNNINAYITAKDLYQSSMNKVCGTENRYIENKILLEHHDKYYEDALNAFDNTPKICGYEFSTECRNKLENEMREMYKNYERINSLKARSKLQKFLTSLWEIISHSGLTLGTLGSVKAIVLSIGSFVTGLFPSINIVILSLLWMSSSIVIIVTSIKQWMMYISNYTATLIGNATAQILQLIMDMLIRAKNIIILIVIFTCVILYLIIIWIIWRLISNALTMIL